METISISRFKATCLAVLQRVRKTRKPVLVTRFGEPVAEIVPPPTAPMSKHWLGCLQDRGKITGEIESPVVDAGEWEVLRE